MHQATSLTSPSIRTSKRGRSPLRNSSTDCQPMPTLPNRLLSQAGVRTRMRASGPTESMSRKICTAIGARHRHGARLAVELGRQRLHGIAGHSQLVGQDRGAAAGEDHQGRLGVEQAPARPRCRCRRHPRPPASGGRPERPGRRARWRGRAPRSATTRDAAPGRRRRGRGPPGAAWIARPATWG